MPINLDTYTEPYFYIRDKVSNKVLVEYGSDFYEWSRIIFVSEDDARSCIKTLGLNPDDVKIEFSSGKKSTAN